MNDGFIMVLLTAVGVGGSTVIGACIGFMFKKMTHKFSDVVLSFAAGVMLAASVWSLLNPAIAAAEAIAELTGTE